MSAPAWLTEAIATEKADIARFVPAVPAFPNGLREHGCMTGKPVNKGFAGFVPAVPAVPAENEAPSKYSDVAREAAPTTNGIPENSSVGKVAANDEAETTDDGKPEASLPMAAELKPLTESVGAGDSLTQIEEHGGADLPEPVTATNAYPKFDEESLHYAWRYYFDDQEPETGVFLVPVNHRHALKANLTAIAAIPLHLTEGVSCKTCLHSSRPGGWPSPLLCGGRDDLPPAFGINHPLRELPEDGGVNCSTYRHISEKGKK